MRMFILLSMFVSAVCLGSEIDELDSQIVEQLPAFTNAPSWESYRTLKELMGKMIELDGLDPRGYEHMIFLNESAYGKLYSKAPAYRMKHYEVIQLYLKAIDEKLDTFRRDPNQECFDIIKNAAEQLIALDAGRSTGYYKLFSLYIASEGVLMDKLTCIEESIKLAKQYQATEGRKDDLSDKIKDFESRYIFLAESRRQAIRSERMFDWDNQPECVLEARRLFDEAFHMGKRNAQFQALLDQAIEVLKAGLREEPSNYKIYVKMCEVYTFKGDFSNAYVTWRLAYQMGEPDDLPVLNLAQDLYHKALDYALYGAVDEKNPGGDYGLYFIWLNRETISETLPPDMKSCIDELVSEAAKRRQELIRQDNE